MGTHVQCLLGAPEASDTDPFAMFADWDTGSLALLAGLVMLAVVVFAYGSRRAQRGRTTSSLRPQGRVLADHGTRHFGAGWRAKATRLEEREPTAVADAGATAVRLVATIVRTTGSLGGEPERACVWRNRAGARPNSAVGSELIIVADDTGRCGVENLERARVTAPVEKAGVHYEWTSLYVGDRVELLGTFAPDPTTENADDARDVVYGTLGEKGPLEVRLIERPPSVSPQAPQADAEPDADPDPVSTPDPEP